MTHRRVPLASLVFLLVVNSLACDDTPPLAGPIPVHPVRGTVMVKGKPAADVLVTFHPSGSPSRPGEVTSSPTGKTHAEGKYQLHTYLGTDGAPAGQYAVSLTFAGSAESRDIMSKNQTIAITKIPAKYSDPRKSGLTATVKEGDNAIDPFEIK